jgi:hypothetical protein
MVTVDGPRQVSGIYGKINVSGQVRHNKDEDDNPN